MVFRLDWLEKTDLISELITEKTSYHLDRNFLLLLILLNIDSSPKFFFANETNSL